VLNVFHIGARDFSQLDSESISEILTQHQLYWIATKPNLQLSIFSQISKHGCKVILEKPLATSGQSWAELTELVSNANSQVFFSQPWTFSELWNCALAEFEDLNFPISVEIYRTGQEYRADFTAKQDWLPHDLYLVESLIYKLNLSKEEIAVLPSENSSLNTIYIGDKVRVMINFSIGSARRMQWKITAGQGISLDIDFSRMTLKKWRENTIVSERTYSTDHPLANMVNQYFTTFDDERVNRVPALQEIIATNFQNIEIRMS
jgi:predicted dehydrogenase